jgi:hypothetical protein
MQSCKYKNANLKYDTFLLVGLGLNQETGMESFLFCPQYIARVHLTEYYLLNKLASKP